ncbi:peptidyl-prolyl cis-trans isomerase [Paenibacillus whitsoniae]|uniref:Peptidyl-prolyl cis-trans isomerase n=1 Tax=Paenibacillus whitsoniae TaxID=2496558 RepID=A0A430JIH9_9BACL|nr:peptidyl-prolyl cis-trans isomerase [Paenibacillus whitsoniae]RTE10867.1 hypothetical protein EJQ19_06290 [Paenibacillus whitsoniae]
MKGKQRVKKRLASWLIASVLLMGGAVSVAVLTGFQDDSLGRINDSSVDRREFALLLAQQRSQTVQYFKQHYKAAVNETFWETSFDGVTPADYAKQAALDQLIKYRVEQQLARSHGLDVSSDYGEFLQRLRKENEQRKSALRTGSPIYGPAQYSEWSYYDYLHSNLIIKLKEKLQEGGEVATEEALYKIYEEQKDNRYRMPEEATVNVMSFPLGDGNRAVNALSMLTGGASFAQVRSELSPFVMNRRADGEAIRLGGAGTEDHAEAEELLLKTALQLEEGKAARVDLANRASVLQLISKTDHQYLPFEQVKETIRHEWNDQGFERHIELLKKQAKVELNQRNLQRINAAE